MPNTRGKFRADYIHNDRAYPEFNIHNITSIPPNVRRQTEHIPYQTQYNTPIPTIRNDTEYLNATIQLHPIPNPAISELSTTDENTDYDAGRKCLNHKADTFTITKDKSEIIAMISQKRINNITKRKQPRKLIVGMTFDCEEWLLEIKLNEIGDVVDHFIIVEGRYTFQNDERLQCFPLIMKSNEQISKWHDKIIYVYDIEPISNFEYWEAEVHYRNTIGLKGLKSIQTSDDDLVIVTDMDELPHPNFLWVLKWYDGFKEAINISFLWSYYSFKWINTKTWNTNAILSIRELQSINNQTNRIRFDMAGQQGWTTSDMIVGWHCSWCLPTHVFVDKLSHFAHRELNQEKFKNIEWLESMRTQGLWFPDSAPNGCIQSHLQLPEYVQANAQKFEKLWK